MQFDWGEFHYEKDGNARKLYGFTAILGYSRMRFVTFVKRCDTPTMIRCLMEAFDTNLHSHMPDRYEGSR